MKANGSSTGASSLHRLLPAICPSDALRSFDNRSGGSPLHLPITCSSSCAPAGDMSTPGTRVKWRRSGLSGQQRRAGRRWAATRAPQAGVQAGRRSRMGPRCPRSLVSHLHHTCCLAHAACGQEGNARAPSLSISAPDQAARACFLTSAAAGPTVRPCKHGRPVGPHAIVVPPTLPPNPQSRRPRAAGRRSSPSLPTCTKPGCGRTAMRCSSS